VEIKHENGTDKFTSRIVERVSLDRFIIYYHLIKPDTFKIF